MSQLKNPKGVVGVFISPQGDVVASVSVFERCGSQKSLASMRLAYEVAKAYCSPVFVNAMSEYDREKIVGSMRRSGFKEKYILIGYDDE